MSFSSDIKIELSNLNTYSKKELIEAELIGYLYSSNTKKDAQLKEPGIQGEKK